MKILSEISPPLRHRRRGFTFIEVLFAVILLGIGFIMIAAVFPVALQENKSNSDETEGMGVTRSAIRDIQANAYKANFSVTGQTVAAYSGRRIGADAYDTGDHRYGWSIFYRRINADDPFMQVWVVALQNPNFITGTDPLQSPTLAYSNLGITATFGSNDDVILSPATATNAAEGAFLIVSANGTTTGPAAGRVFRLGPNLQDPANPLHFQLEPGFDDVSATDVGGPASVYIIGRALVTDPSGNVGFDGPNQDLVVETSYVRFLDNTP